MSERLNGQVPRGGTWTGAGRARRRPVWPVVALVALLLPTTSVTIAGAEPATVASPSAPAVVFGPVADGPTGLTLRGGVETLTVTGAAPNEAVTLVDASGADRLTLLADAAGQAHFAYLPSTPQVVQSGTGELPGVEGGVVEPGSYRVRRGVTLSDPVDVLAIGDVPDQAFYDSESVGAGFDYVTMRDGVELSVMVRLPGPIEDGPYPTVVEYSGYGPSDPNTPQPGSRIAGFLGFATVGVNMRGTGCSGGVFDIFNPAQQADGYDVIEAIAAQPWVANHEVGMIGLSYAGISQLYVAATRPPHLAAITPLSVIDEPWRQQWPGGVYNDGFTKQWLAERDNQASAGGQSWDATLIAQGDTVCETNQSIRSQNVDFQSFGEQLTNYPDALDSRFLQLLVPKIDVPVYLTGAYQDEQTGARFTYLLDKFTSAPIRRFKLFNGHHPDGYSPMVITDWHDFLSFYVKRQVPYISGTLQYFSPAVFEEEFGIRKGFGPNRFSSFGDYGAALAAYESEPEVQFLVESGGATTPPGATGERTRWSFDRYPPREARNEAWYLDADGSLATSAPELENSDWFVPEPGAGEITTTSASSTQFQQPFPTLNEHWEQGPEGTLVAYATPVLDRNLVLGGPGYLDLWFRAGAPDGAVQVDLSEIRPDGQETYVQSGWHELQHSALRSDLTSGVPLGAASTAASGMLHPEYSYSAAGRAPLDPDAWEHRLVPIPGVTHVFRPGSRMRVTISAPGRSRPLWTFANPDRPADAEIEIGRGGAVASRLVMPALDGVSVPEGRPACDTLRGQPCRTYTSVANAPARLDAGAVDVACPADTASARLDLARTTDAGDGTIELTSTEVTSVSPSSAVLTATPATASLDPDGASVPLTVRGPAGSSAVVTARYTLDGASTPLGGTFQVRTRVQLGAPCATSATSTTVSLSTSTTAAPAAPAAPDPAPTSTSTVTSSSASTSTSTSTSTSIVDVGGAVLSRQRDVVSTVSGGVLAPVFTG